MKGTKFDGTSFETSSTEGLSVIDESKIWLGTFAFLNAIMGLRDISDGDLKDINDVEFTLTYADRKSQPTVSIQLDLENSSDQELLKTQEYRDALETIKFYLAGSNLRTPLKTLTFKWHDKPWPVFLEKGSLGHAVPATL